MLLISANISTYTPTHSMSPLSLWVNCSGHFLSSLFKYWIPCPLTQQLPSCNHYIIDFPFSALLSPIRTQIIQTIHDHQIFSRHHVPLYIFSSVQFTQSCPTLCDPMDCSTPGLPAHHQLLEFTQIHIHQVSDAIQPSHPLLSPSPPAPTPSQHQSLFQ